MKLYYKKVLLALALSCAMVVSCDDQDYVDANNDPDVLTDIPPENQFLNATIAIHSQDFEAFYDFYLKIMPWMQYVTPPAGNGESFTLNVGNFPNRYNRLYTGVGNTLVDMEKIIEAQPVEMQPTFEHMNHIGHILKAYYAFYVSDVYGSIAYSDAFQARYGGTTTPEYDDQQTLFGALDQQIETAVNGLKATPTVAQVSLGSFDQYYGGNAQAWIKAANALRLRMAMRLLKRDEATATAIINEVLGDDGNLMESNSDGWVLKATASMTSGGNWDAGSIVASKPLVDFMLAKGDPRLDVFVEPNDYSQANINVMIADGKLPAGTTATNRYVGSFTSPDDAADQDIQDHYYTLRRTDAGQTFDTLSYVQRRLFQPAFDSGTGSNYFPVITYADFCFMRAELAALGITTDDAEEFYEEGITASINWYNDVAIGAGLTNYTTVASSEITDYLAEPGVAFDAGKAVEQIACQAFLNDFRQPAEGWSVWRRTGFPNTTSVFAVTDMKTSGVSLPIPRRAPLSELIEGTPNYANKKAAYDAMASDPNFGAGPNDAFGRVWWDKP